MKLRLPKLHNQILIALVAGAIFGSVFNVSRTALIISYKINNQINSQKFKDWKNFFIVSEGLTADTIKFSNHQQVDILNYFKKIKNNGKSISIVVEKYSSNEFESKLNLALLQNVISVDKEKTIATQIKWIGDIFIRLLTMIAIPLVLGSLTVGAASLGDIKKFARIGGKTISFYLVTTAIAISIGLVTANLINLVKEWMLRLRNDCFQFIVRMLKLKLKVQKVMISCRRL